MQRADRLGERIAQRREDTGRVEAAVGASGELLLSPGQIHVAGGVERLLAEVAREAGQRSVTLQTAEESVDIPYDSIVRGNLIEEGGKR